MGDMQKPMQVIKNTKVTKRKMANAWNDFLKLILLFYLLNSFIGVWNHDSKLLTVFNRQAVVISVQAEVYSPQGEQELLEEETPLPPESLSVEDQIRTVAKNLNFEDADLLVEIAKCESSLNPKAKNSTSSATGLFQILDMHGLTTEERMDVEISTGWTINKINNGGLNAWAASEHCWK